MEKTSHAASINAVQKSSSTCPGGGRRPPLHLDVSAHKQSSNSINSGFRQPRSPCIKSMRTGSANFPSGGVGLRCSSISNYPSGSCKNDPNHLYPPSNRPRRMSVISLRRGSRAASKIFDVATGGGSKSRKEGCGFLSAETLSGIKYGVVWTIYVLIGSWLFLEFEKTTTEKTFVEHDHWTRYKELVQLSGGSEVLIELSYLRQQLYAICPHPHFLGDQDRSNGTSSSDDIGYHSNGTARVEESLQMDDATLTNTTHLEAHCTEALGVMDHITVVSKWSYVDAVYYTMTLVTTIGYGNIFPSTRIGRLFAVLYAMVGVPLTCILMAKNSEIMSKKMLQLYNRLKDKYNKNSQSKNLLYLVSWMYLTIGFIVLMFIPSVAFVYMEGWTYDQSLYYTFITLSTIGFGDLIGAYGSAEPYSDLYKMTIVIWIMFALGYWVLLLNFLQKALKKKIVPKRIRVQFKAKQLAKQAEFLRQLMTKVREQSSDKSDDEDGSTGHLVTTDRRKSMALIAEVAGVLNNKVSTSIRTAGPTRRQSIIRQRSVSVNDDIVSPAVDYQNEASLCLTDLLSAVVVVRTPKVNLLKSLIGQSNKTNRNKIDKYGRQILGTKSEEIQFNNEESGKGCNEVTLPLKDVLGLVTLVANLENQIEGGNPLIDDQSSLYSTIHSMVSMDAKLPLLREAFIGMQGINIGPETSNEIQQQQQQQQQQAASESVKPSVKYKPVVTTACGGVVPLIKVNNRMYQRRGSCLDAFIDDQTKREYVEIGKENSNEINHLGDINNDVDDDDDDDDDESEEKTETITDEMETTEEVDLDMVGDMDTDDDDEDYDDTFNGTDTILSLDEEDDKDNDDAKIV